MVIQLRRTFSIKPLGASAVAREDVLGRVHTRKRDAEGLPCIVSNFEGHARASMRYRTVVGSVWIDIAESSALAHICFSRLISKRQWICSNKTFRTSLKPSLRDPGSSLSFDLGMLQLIGNMYCFIALYHGSGAFLELDCLVTSFSVFMFVISARVTLGGVIKERSPSAIFDGIDNVNSEVRVAFEAVPIRCGILVASWIHDLSGSDLADKLSKWRRRRRLLVDRLHLFRAGDQTSFVASLAELVNGQILQLCHLQSVAHSVQLLTGICMVPFLVYRECRDVINFSLIEPFHKQFECSRILIGQLDSAASDLAIRIDDLVFEKA
jgi:hypothetical protein